MAAKKSTKKNTGDSTTAKKKDLLGKAVYYMGLKTQGFICPVCKKKINKGIIYEHNNTLHCSRTCIDTLIGA